MRATSRLSVTALLAFAMAVGCADQQAAPPPTVVPVGPDGTDPDATEDGGPLGELPDGAEPADDAATDAAPFIPGPKCVAKPEDGAKIRLAAANLTSSGQKYGEPGIRILRGIKADVVMLQEMNYLTSSDSDIRAFVTAAFGAQYQYVRGPQAEIPNGIASRFPILASGSWIDTEVGNRTFVWARIDIPGPTDLYAISVHFLTSGSAKRDVEAKLVVDQVRSNVPAGAWVTLGGDFNTDNRNESAIGSLSPVFATGAPYPADGKGNGNTSANRSKPYDWVLVDRSLETCRVPSVVGTSTFVDGMVVDTRVHTPLSDLAPALAADSDAAEMQHMAVVRDFLVPLAP